MILDDLHFNGKNTIADLGRGIMVFFRIDTSPENYHCDNLLIYESYKLN